MLRLSILFYVLGLTSILFGANNIGGLSVEVGKWLLLIFLFVSVVLFAWSLFFGKVSVSGSFKFDRSGRRSIK
jgi:hypothetical protein